MANAKVMKVTDSQLKMMNNWEKKVQKLQKGELENLEQVIREATKSIKNISRMDPQYMEKRQKLQEKIRIAREESNRLKSDRNSKSVTSKSTNA